MKLRTAGRWLWARTILSTVVGEGVDSLLFVLIAFYGTQPMPLLQAVILSNYVFKVGVEALATPATYALTGFLKQRENEDYYDYGTDFNPFRVG
jgi:hypothetical protein